jgi:hypothetical protein
MTGLLIPVICLFSFLLCSTREAAAGARPAGQMWATARRAGWGRTPFMAARVAVLLILADARRLAGHAEKAVRIFVEALAVYAEIIGLLVTRTEVRA